ncbi:proton channel OTOP2-like isoform X2 [Boleophthalmus pectinirostris]|uniref:proton channel OTOP2-like isoform X2 n=1 Tax=Boleophthalmus pectinirostris TaxID=150288 RepID=UPI00242DBD44|nr:proton channel OTOP2-like isoform X2 [Boleophthalmus pectinirostris]
MQSAPQQIFQRTCNNLLSRKMTNHNRIVEAHPSNIETASHHAHVQEESAVTMESTVERAKTTGGKLISGIIFFNIFFLGCAIVCGSAFKNITITPVHRQVYLIILLLLTTSWMIFYMVHTFHKDQHMLSKDIHAAPVWLRAGLVMFGILSLLMDVLKISNYVGYIDCDSDAAIKIASPVIQALFLFVQTYFFLTHAKDCVLSNKNITWCGLTITLSTNLVVWMEAVTEESLHQTELPKFYENYSDRMYKVSYGDKTCRCNQSCSIFKGAYHYLYPFNIEYSLFASAMAYVMWKNVGRLIEGQSHHNFKFHAKENYFIIEGLHREPFHMVQHSVMPNSSDAFQESTELSVVAENHWTSYRHSSTVDKLNWKRRVLKEVCLFLLLANIILWIMPAFGARPQFDQTIEIIFYKFTMWATIVNIGLPFGIFYRLHSVASLFEVYLIS